MSKNASKLGDHVPREPGADDDRFARSFKGWREWNVAVNFLSNLHIEFDEAEVLATAIDPPDVIFRDAKFEVKEIMDRDRRRHDEAKAARAEAEANDGKVELKHYTPEDIAPDQIGDLVEEVLPALKYKADVRNELDLLFYVNKLEHWFKDGPVPSAERFTKWGYRSISAVCASQNSIVFCTAPFAPEILRRNVGKVRYRFEDEI